MAYIPTQSYEPGFPIEWEGLDYESANEATPRLYAVLLLCCERRQTRTAYPRYVNA
jgi:hypothetical protein